MAEKRSFGSATSKQRQTDPNVLKLGDQTKIRLVDPQVVAWRQHFIESADDNEQGRSVVCPKGPDGTYAAPCPLCMKPSADGVEQRFQVSRRFATNVWDYESGTVKVLIAGKQVFEEFDTRVAAGMDPMACDWVIMKMGKNKNTKYKMIPANDSPFTAAEIGPDDLHDLDGYANPATVEQIFERLEEMGIDYDALELPSFTVEEAESFQIPYTKHRGMTMEQIYAADRDFMLYLYGEKLKQEQYGDPVFVAMHVVLHDRGDVEDLPEVTIPTTSTRSAPSPKPAAAAPAASGMVVLVAPDGTVGEFPAAAKDGLMGAGFTEPEPEPEPESDDGPADDDEVQVSIDGNVVPMAYGVAKTLIASGAATLVEGGPEPEPETAPAEPADDDVVSVDVSGTLASMAYKDAKPLIASGLAKLAEAASEPEPAPYRLPDDDEVVQVKIRSVPTPIDMKFSDAKNAVVALGQGEFVDQELAAAVQADRDDDKDVAAAAREAAEDPSTPSGPGSDSDGQNSGGAAGGDPYDTSLTVKNDDGTWGHPALGSETKKSKGAVTQALNRLKSKAPSASANGNGASADDDKREVAKRLLEEADIQDFQQMLALFEEASGGQKRNIAEFDDSELDKLIELVGNLSS